MPSWVIFFSRECKLFSRGTKFFLVGQDFFSWVTYVSPGYVYLLFGKGFFCTFCERSKLCFRGITQVISIDHDQTKVLGKLIRKIKEF